MDSLFNLVIILIPVAIFIGRIVVQARGRHAPPPPRPPPIPIHFEDDDDYEEYDFSPAPITRKAVADSISKAKPLVSPESFAAARENILPTKLVPVPERPERKEEFAFNLNHLSPLKQAVVMAEILGPPKGML